MKTLLLFTVLFLSNFIVNAQSLVVGFSNPNEVLTLTSGTYTYDTLYILNNGELNLSNQVNFTVNNIVALTGNGKLNVNHSIFTVNQLLYMQDSAVASFADTVNLTCSIFITGHSILNIDSAIVNIPMTYKGQYSWAANENAGININNSQCNLGAGALGGNFIDSSFFHQHNTNYVSALLPMTVGFAGNSSLIIDSCSGGMELVISQAADVDINSSNFFVIWYTFVDGDTVNYSYPPANSTIPNASKITGNYYFADSLPQIFGVDFSIHIANSDAIFWGILSRKNSSVSINNSTLIACGFYFDSTTVNVANNFIDSQNYTAYQASFTDRQFQVNNTKIEAWNFYPIDSAEITIDSCIYGESLGFHNSITRVINSTCDGSGGYFGGGNSSKTYVYNSQIIRTIGTQQIINFQDNSEAWFYNSIILGASVVNNNSKMYYANCQFDSIPVVNDNGYFAEIWLDSLSNGFVDSIINISGIISGINGPINLSKITRYKIQYSLLDSSNMILIKDTTATNFSLTNQSLANWNTSSISVGDYLVWLTIFVNGDSAISCNRNVYLNSINGVLESISANEVLIYPNPAKEYVIIKLETLFQYKKAEIHICNINGQELKTYNIDKTSDYLRISTDEFQNGTYIYYIKTNRGISKAKRFVISK